MTVPHQSMGYPADAPPVRPGTSDALTARTIDATVHPPLIRAQESVTGLVPRVGEAVAPLASPLFLGALGLTLTFVVVAQRMRYRPSALLLSGMLVMTLTSFRPVPAPEPPGVTPVGQVRIPRTVNRGSKAWYRYQLAQRQQEQPPVPVEELEPMVAADEPVPDVPVPPTPPTPPDPVEGPILLPAPRGFETPPLPFAHLPEVSARMVRSAEQMMRDNEQMQRLMQNMRDNQQVQRIMQQVRSRMREEARRRRWQRDYERVVTR
jgi:hypothetical protein